MKILLTLCTVFCIARVYCDGEDTRKSEVDECARQNNVDVKQFDELRKGAKFTPTRPMNCFSACLLKKRGLMDQSGKFVPLFEKTELGKTCKPEYGQDECETAGKLITCIARNDMAEKIKQKIEQS